jgi:hypothetical protein
LLAARRAILPSLSRLAPLTILEDATVPRARIAEMVERIDAITARHGVRIAAGAHAGDGNLHPTCVLHPADGGRNRDRTSRLRRDLLPRWSWERTITGDDGVGLAKLRDRRVPCAASRARCQRRWRRQDRAARRRAVRRRSPSRSRTHRQVPAPVGAGRLNERASHFVALEDGECSGALTFVFDVRAVIADPIAGPNEHTAGVVDHG